MAATSEELAAQAEQLQTSIAYFHTEPHEAAPARPPAPAKRPTQHPVAAGGMRTKRPAAPAVRSNGKPNGHDASHADEVVLDLAGGGDSHDHEFMRF
jgi:methyl-accepting chemotaxis protein